MFWIACCRHSCCFVGFSLPLVGIGCFRCCCEALLLIVGVSCAWCLSFSMGVLRIVWCVMCIVFVFAMLLFVFIFVRLREAIVFGRCLLLVVVCLLVVSFVGIVVVSC